MGELDKQGVELADGCKTLNPLLNVSDIVSKFAKVCKLRSIGVFNTSENPDRGYPIICGGNGSLLDEESSDANGDVYNATKVYPQPDEVRKNRNVYDQVKILELFDMLLALKLAYVKLQEAHIPYDPEKIRAADEEVVSQLDSLCAIKKASKVKEATSVSALLIGKIQVNERALEKLKSRAKIKDREVANLRQKLHELESRNKKLADEIEDRERESFMGLNHCFLENVVKAVGKAIHDFTKPLIALMKVSNWDLDEAANAIQSSVVYAKRSHKKYVFEAYVARRMFHGFLQQKTCLLGNLMKLDDPIDALMEDPQSSFAKFCRTKYLLVVHPKMEESFFGNLDHRNFVANGFHPCTPFYRAFVRMARCVWYLQALTAFIEPEAEIFGVKQGSEFSDVYMEAIDELEEYITLGNDEEGYKVEFMVIPGFKLKETLIRSRVYVSREGVLKRPSFGEETVKALFVKTDRGYPKI